MMSIKFLVCGVMLFCSDSLAVRNNQLKQETARVGPISEIFTGENSKLFQIWNSDQHNTNVVTENHKVSTKSDPNRIFRRKRSNSGDESMNMGELPSMSEALGKMAETAGDMTFLQKLAMVREMQYNVSVPITTPRPAFKKWTKRPIRAANTQAREQESPSVTQPPPPPPKQQPRPNPSELDSRPPPIQHQELSPSVPAQPDDQTPQKPETSSRQAPPVEASRNREPQAEASRNQGPSEEGPVENPMSRNPYIPPPAIEAQSGDAPATAQTIPVAPTGEALAEMEEARSEGYKPSANQQPYIPDAGQRRFLPNQNRQLMNAPADPQPNQASPQETTQLKANPFSISDQPTGSLPSPNRQQAGPYPTDPNQEIPGSQGYYPVDPRQPPPYNPDPIPPQNYDPFPVDPKHPPPVSNPVKLSANPTDPRRLSPYNPAPIPPQNYDPFPVNPTNSARQPSASQPLPPQPNQQLSPSTILNQQQPRYSKNTGSGQMPYMPPKEAFIANNPNRQYNSNNPYPNGQYPSNQAPVNQQYPPNQATPQHIGPYGQANPQHPAHTQYAQPPIENGGDDVLHHLPVGHYPANTGAAQTTQTSPIQDPRQHPYPGWNQGYQNQPAQLQRQDFNPNRRDRTAWQQRFNNQQAPGQPIPTNPSPTGHYTGYPTGQTTHTGHQFTDKFPHPTEHSPGSVVDPRQLNPGYPPNYLHAHTTLPPPTPTRPMTEAEREAMEEAAEDRQEALMRLNMQGYNLTALPPNYTIPPETEEIEYEDGLTPPPPSTPSPYTRSPYWFEGPPYNGMHYFAKGSPGIYPDSVHGKDVGIYPLTTPPTVNHPYHLMTGYPANQKQPYNYPNQPANQQSYYNQPRPSQQPMRKIPYYPQQNQPIRYQNSQARYPYAYQQPTRQPAANRQPVILNQRPGTQTNQNAQQRPPSQQTYQNPNSRSTNQINRNYQQTNQRQPVQSKPQQAPPRTQQTLSRTQQVQPRNQQPPKQAQIPEQQNIPVPRKNTGQRGQAAFLNQDAVTTTTIATVVSKEPEVVATANSGPTTNEVAGIVVGTILGILVIIIPLLCLGIKYKKYLKQKRKRFFPRPFSQRNESRGSRDAMDTMVFSELGQQTLAFDSDGHLSPTENDRLMSRRQSHSNNIPVATISGGDETNLYNNNTENNSSQSEAPSQPMSLTSSKRADSLEISRLITLRQEKDEEIYSEPPEEPPVAPVLPPRGKTRGKGFPKHFNGSVQMLHK